MLWYDFFVFYPAAVLLASGGNPYDLAQYRATSLAFGFPADKVFYPFLYPPWSAPLLYPLGFLSWDAALALATVLASAVSLIVGIGATSCTSHPAWLTTAKRTALCVVFTPFLKNIFFGQIAWIVFAAIGGSLLLKARGAFFLSGLTLSLAIAKPHIAGPVIAFALTSSLFAKDKPLIVGFIAGAMLQLALSALILKLSPADYVATFALSAQHDSAAAILTATPMSWLLAIVPLKALVAASLLSGIVAGVRLGTLYRFTIESTFLLVAPVALLLAPYAWGHDYLLLLPTAIGWIIAAFGKSERRCLFCWFGWTGLCLAITAYGEWLLPLAFIPPAAWAVAAYGKSPSIHTRISRLP